MVLDGGTGLRNLTKLLGAAPFQGSILLGHLHWDHTQGLPFFEAGMRPGAHVDVRIPEQGDPCEVMAKAFAPPFFPAKIESLAGSWTINSIDEGEQEIQGFRVLAMEIPHKLSRTFGYRITDGDTSIAYLSDHWPRSLGLGPDGHGEYHDAAIALTQGVDLLIHDSQYTPTEFETKSDFGHCTIDYALGLAKASGARALSLFHHDPERTDDQLDEIIESLAFASIPVTAAIEGSIIEI